MRDIFSAIREVILTVSGVDEVIEANPNAHSPKGTYATVMIAQSARPTSMGTVSQKIINDGRDMTVTNKYPVVWECTVNFYRGDAFGNASKLLRMQYLPVIADYFLERGIGLVDCSNLNNLTALQSSNFEQRAVITISLVTWEEISQDVGVILSCSGSVQYENGKTLQTF